MQEKEIWKPIEGFDGYEVSSLGKVRSIDKIVIGKNNCQYFKHGRILKTSIGRNGYEKIVLRKNKKKINLEIHRIAAIAFIPNPNNYPCINHKDENKTNNRINNLEWCTTQYNNRYSKDKPICRFDMNGDFIKKYDRINDVKYDGFCPSGANQCALGHSYSYYNSIWLYENNEYIIDNKVSKEYIGYIKSNKGQSTKKVKVDMLSLDGKYIKTFDSYSEISSIGLNKRKVSSILKKGGHISQGYMWKYAE